MKKKKWRRKTTSSKVGFGWYNTCSLYTQYAPSILPRSSCIFSKINPRCHPQRHHLPTRRCHCGPPRDHCEGSNSFRGAKVSSHPCSDQQKSMHGLCLSPTKGPPELDRFEPRCPSTYKPPPSSVSVPQIFEARPTTYGMSENLNAGSLSIHPSIHSSIYLQALFKKKRHQKKKPRILKQGSLFQSRHFHS